MKERIAKNKAPLFLAISVVFVLSLPVLQEGFFYSHDLGFHLQRIESIANGFSRGEWFIRIYKELYDGYGYGAPIYYPHLFLYVPALLHYVGVPVYHAYRIFVVLVNCLTVGLSYYGYTKLSGSKEIGFFAAILYSTATYRLVDLYTRASVGEYLALTFLPLFLLALLDILRGKQNRWLLLAISVSCVLQSHILSFVILIMMGLGCVMFYLPALKRLSVWKALAQAMVVFVLLNAWFLLPFLEGNMLPIYSGSDQFEETGMLAAQIFDVLTKGAAGSEMLETVSITKTPGSLLLLGMFFLLYCLVMKRQNLKELVRKHYLLAVCALIGGIALIASTELFCWDLLLKVEPIGSLFRKMQFAWRFNIVTVLFWSFASAYGYAAILKEAKDAKLIVALLAVVSVVIFVNQYIQGGKPFAPEPYMDTLYLMEGNTIDSREVLESNVSEIRCEDYCRMESQVSLRYQIVAKESDEQRPYLDVPIAYYPGYVAYVDGVAQETTLSPAGVVRVELPKTEGYLEVTYREKTSYLICDAVSLLTLFALTGMWVWKVRKK